MHLIYMMHTKTERNRNTVKLCKEQYRNLLDQGFPYLMVSPGVLLLIFVVVFPIIFVILMDLNYDLYHSPPAKLVDWVGFKTLLISLHYRCGENVLSVFSWTVIWTFVATAHYKLHLVFS